ncbi:hypothetical protein FGG08_005627 [Glutinoglossum americanum]|uniref:polynucleotide adenylyltransferase n=1 Tax=Glutinoglossum americanum TaxID=1670608 RepID=A0A9P8I921_9PEZI|nr:hypothetical protein FGG08_005627 [Glutinoglossum americanum]
MPSKKPEFSHPLPTRPVLQHNSSQISQQSNSVPSTPHQHARKLSFDSRSPSPSGALNHSPRSAYSESNSTLLPLRKPPPGCKYEKGMANSRRRMPYDIGDAKLEKVKGQLKKKLNQDEEKKLTQAMKELYERLLPSPESEDRRARFVQKLEKLLNDQWPGNDIRVRVFGSSGNKLCTFDSDDGMERVVCVPNAKVPIVKIWDPELQLACDMNVNNTLALENTRMIKTYVDIDERVRPLAMIIKYWTKRRILNDAALGGTLSSYTWICTIINFLQTREPPILPSLHQRSHQRREFIDGVDVSFDDDLESLRGFGDKNKETLGELLFHFFRRYGHEIDYEKFVVSVRQGKLISKEEKGWHLMQNNRLCVEEPFNIKRNLGNTADDTSVRGLHIELRRAFTLIAEEVNLDKCCEQYIWPIEQKPVWEKPPPQPRPVLSRSSSQTGRGGRGGHGSARGGRHSNNHSFRGSLRRASSGAAIANGHPVLLPQHQVGGMSTQEYNMQAYHAQHQLQDHLYQSYQLLQAQLQESELRYQMLHQAQAQVQAQARNQPTTHASGQASPAPYTNGHTSPHPGPLEIPPLTAPIRPSFYIYPLQYANAIPTQPHQQGSSTNPSSPSVTPVVPELRRSLHRSSVGSSAGSFRSQSQPASRPLPSALNLQGLAASNYGFGGLPAYEQVRQQRREVQVDDPGDGQLEMPLESNSLIPGVDSSPDEQPKEYVGYYQREAAQPVYNHLEMSSLPHISAYAELPLRQRRVSPDQLPPPISSRLRQNSRSPSPLGHNTALLSGPQVGVPAPVFSQTGLMNETTTSTRESVQDRPVGDRSPLIVNGSTMSAFADSGSIEPHLSHEEQNCDLCSSAFEPHIQDQPQGAASELNRHKLYAQQLLEKHNQAETAKSEPGIVNSSHGMRVNHLATPSSSIPASTSPYSNASTSLLHLPSDEEGNSSPRLSPNLRQRASRRVSLLPANGIPPLDTTRATTDATHENILSTASPLTPVPEMRTPSPTIYRSLTGPLGMDVDGPKGGRNDRKPKTPQPPPTPANMTSKQKQVDLPGPGVNGHIRGSASVGGGTPNSWQGPKPNRRRPGTKKGLGVGKNFIEGLPADESERKGG